MHIQFSPQRRSGPLSLSRAGDILTINEQAFDFSAIPDGGEIPAGAVPCEWIVGPVERRDGEIQLTLILPHGAGPEPHMAFPEPMHVTEDGPIDVPYSTYRERQEEPAEGGTTVTVTTYRWRQAPAEVIEFIPDPPSAEQQAEESANVEP